MGVWQLLSPTNFLHHIPASVPGSQTVGGERGHPGLHHSGRSKESPAAVGPGTGPQTPKRQEGGLGAMLAAPHKTSSVRGEHLLKWTDSRFKWKTRSSRVFFHALGRSPVEFTGIEGS